MNREPQFLEVQDVLALHAQQLRIYGGGDGVRDLGLLESAVAQPAMSFGGDFAHEGVVAMAAAYLFHLVSNPPFMDGNKRIGLLSALVFLELNGHPPHHSTEALCELVMELAQSQLTKAQVQQRLEALLQAPT